jgi:hypothetical protein
MNFIMGAIAVRFTTDKAMDNPLRFIPTLKTRRRARLRLRTDRGRLPYPDLLVPRIDDIQTGR